MLNRSGNTVVEYAIILGIVILAFSTMNIYIKRGVQGRVKDMADGYIGSGEPMQASNTNVKAISTSATNSVADSSYTVQDLSGGARELVLSEQSSVSAVSRTEDMKKITVPDTTVTGSDSAIVDPVLTSQYKGDKGTKK